MIQLIGATLSIIVSIGGAAITLGTILWKMAGMHADIRQTKETVDNLLKGDAPVCARHQAKLDSHGIHIRKHEQKLNDMSDRLTKLEVEQAQAEKDE